MFESNDSKNWGSINTMPHPGGDLILSFPSSPGRAAGCWTRPSSPPRAAGRWTPAAADLKLHRRRPHVADLKLHHRLRLAPLLLLRLAPLLAPPAPRALLLFRQVSLSAALPRCWTAGAALPCPSFLLLFLLGLPLLLLCSAAGLLVLLCLLLVLLCSQIDCWCCCACC